MTTVLDSCEHADDRLRTRFVTIAASVACPILALFSLLEVRLGHPEMVLLTAIGAVLCLANLVVARLFGFLRNPVRLAIAWCDGLVLYYMATDFLPSSTLFALLMPLVSAFLLGHREALAWNVAFGLASSALVWNAATLGITGLEGLGIDYTTTYILATALAFASESMRASAQQASHQEHRRLLGEINLKSQIQTRNDALVAELKRALDDVRELSGLLPICASCKKIRDDDGFWEQLETYLRKHSRVTFSHSYCPTCADSVMDDLDQRLRQRRRELKRYPGVRE